jgi:hypothetical protein
MFMSLIHTCRLCATNPLEYLNALQHHAKEALEHPTRWLPWNLRAGAAPPIPAERNLLDLTDPGLVGA